MQILVKLFAFKVRLKGKEYESLKLLWKQILRQYSFFYNFQFSENCSQFPGIHNETRGKRRGQRINQPICLTIVREFQPDAVDRL